MSANQMTIREYSPADETVVVELWQRCRLTRPQNNARLDIQRKLKVNPELFLVGLVDGKVIATVIGGYEGHRGWVNYLGVDPTYQRRGFGRQIMQAVEEKIRAMGSPKINLQVRSDNAEVVKFYKAMGYNVEDVISMGKRLVKD